MAGFYTTFNVFEFNVNGIFTVNTTHIDFGGFSANTTTLFFNTATVGLSISTDKVLVGNSTSNSTINSTSLAVLNSTGTFTAIYGPEALSISNVSTTFQINSVSFSISNVGGNFFFANTTNIRLGVAGNLANLTPTRLSLGDGSTYISPDGLSIGNSTVNSTMNSTHVNVGTVIASSITGNFVGNAQTLDLFGTDKRGIVNASTADANTVLQAGGQWVPSAVFWYEANSGAINQTNLDIFWNGVDYSMIEIAGWFLPSTDPVDLLLTLSDDGSTFTGFSGSYHAKIDYQSWDFNAPAQASYDIDSNDTKFDIYFNTNEDTVAGVFFTVFIHKHHNAFSTVQWRAAGHQETEGEDDLGCTRGFGVVNDTSPILGARFSFSTGNILNHNYVVKVYPN